MIKMKTIFATLILTVATLFAQQTNQPLVQTTSAPAKVVLVVVVEPEYLPKLMAAISNFSMRIVATEARTKSLETLIRLKEDRIKEMYAGYPDTYTGDGTPESSKTLDKLIVIWAEKATAVSNVTSMKFELEKLRGQP